MKVLVTNNGRQPVFMPGGKLAPGRNATYDLTDALIKQLKTHDSLDVVKVAVKKKAIKKKAKKEAK